MGFPLLRRQVQHEEFDYQVLLDGLREYSRPRDKITGLLAQGRIVRVKKGLYVFGEEDRRRPLVREMLANLAYGPSYLSLEYALHYHGLTPEGTEALTSVTCGRSRTFRTPVGVFSYRRIPLNAFRVGMDRVALDDGRAFLIATPEKALADKIVADPGVHATTQEALHGYLLESLRVAPGALERLDPGRLSEIALRYRSRRVRTLSQLVARLRRETSGG
jgi:hypothetical protein